MVPSPKPTVIVVIQPSRTSADASATTIALREQRPRRLVTDAVVRDLDRRGVEELGDERADRIADRVVGLLGEFERFDRGHRNESRRTFDRSDEGGFRVASGHRVAVTTGRTQRRTVDLAVIGGGPAGAADRHPGGPRGGIGRGVREGRRTVATRSAATASRRVRSARWRSSASTWATRTRSADCG